MDGPYYTPFVRCTYAQMRQWETSGRILITRFGYWDTKILSLIHVEYTD